MEASNVLVYQTETQIYTEAPQPIPNEEPLTTISQHIFGEKTLADGRVKGFTMDLRKLATMTMEDYFASLTALENQSIATANDDQLLWISFKRVWKLI